MIPNVVASPSFSHSAVVSKTIPVVVLLHDDDETDQVKVKDEHFQTLFSTSTANGNTQSCNEPSRTRCHVIDTSNTSSHHRGKNRLPEESYVVAYRDNTR